MVRWAMKKWGGFLFQAYRYRVLIIKIYYLWGIFSFQVMKLSIVTGWGASLPLGDGPGDGAWAWMPKALGIWTSRWNHLGQNKSTGLSLYTWIFLLMIFSNCFGLLQQRIIRTGRTGHWLNHGKEHCLVGVKGQPKNLNRGLDCDVIVAVIWNTQLLLLQILYLNKSYYFLC